MIGGRRVRAIDRDDVHAGQHLVEAFPIGCLQLAFNLRHDTAAVMVVNLQAERTRPAGHRLADPPHAYDAEALSTDAVTEHPGWRQPGHSFSAVITAAPSARLRGTARISAIVMSAVSSVRTPGVLVTVMPRWSAV